MQKHISLWGFIMDRKNKSSWIFFLKDVCNPGCMSGPEDVANGDIHKKTWVI